ncbi:hypothetical protein F4804DRAFT_331550 [Jackrogersella minutella]|nr:hypothetical protein F4804DRAFT_331550 [Jackrogersella minutella]
MAVPFQALLPPGFAVSRCTPEDTPEMTTVCEFLTLTSTVLFLLLFLSSELAVYVGR